MKANPYHVRAAALGLLFAAVAAWAGAAELSAEEIVKHCGNKYAGEDQRSRLSIILEDKDGKTAKSEYLRLWKNYHGKGGIEDKVILFAQSPLDVRGVNFMRWGYTAKTGKLAEQWVYLPEMGRVRRISQRDPNNADWGYTDEDLRNRDPGEDHHRLVGINHDDEGEYYVVESVPGGDSAYGKWVTYFSKTPDWNDCAPRRVYYYDKNGILIKEQFITWNRLNSAWTWDTTIMSNLRDNITATYHMQDTEVNVGLPGRIFSERQLQRGFPELNH